MKLDQARAIHKKTGQRFKRPIWPNYCLEKDGQLYFDYFKKDGQLYFDYGIECDPHWYDPEDLDADDWEVEPLRETIWTDMRTPESQKQDEEDLDTLRRILDSYSLTQIVSDPTMRNIYNMASLLKRKFFGVAE
jgi:hypothetical protein